MSTTTWNHEQEVLIASAEIGDSTGRDAVALLVAARKRAFEANADRVWIKTSDRLPADDARLLAMVVDSTGSERSEIVNFLSCIPEWRLASDDAAI